MAQLNLGVIGLGRMGQVYGYHAARQIENARLVAVADPRQDVTANFSAQISGVTVYQETTDLLNHAGLDAVIIATPTHTHRDMVIAAADKGLAIFAKSPPPLR